MVQDVESEDVGSQAEQPQEDQSRDRRRGPLSVLLLVILLLIILWLLWQFFGRQPESNEVKTTSSTIKIDVPIVPEPEIPAQAVATETVETQAFVPDVVGDNKSSAIATLESAGYVVSVSRVYSESVPAGLVIEQNPDGGTALDAGAVVGIIISRGTGAPEMVTMPQVVGLTQAAAEAKVRAAGLKPYIEHGAYAGTIGRIGSQWPPAGEQLPKGSEGFIQVIEAN